MLDSSVLLPYKRRISSISRLYFKSILPGAREIVQLIKNLLWVGFWHLWEKTRYWGVWFLISVSRDMVGTLYIPLPLSYPHTIIYDWSFIVLCSHYLEILRKLLLVFFLAYLCTLCLGKPNFLPPEVSIFFGSCSGNRGHVPIGSVQKVCLLPSFWEVNFPGPKSTLVLLRQNILNIGSLGKLLRRLCPHWLLFTGR